MIIAANFKTNHTRASTVEYIMDLNMFIQANNIDSQVYIFPPATALDSFETDKITIGVQNAAAMYSGSMTGEIGLAQIEEFHLNTIMIGHSERRHIAGETQEEITKKFNFYKENDFTIVYCVGEPLDVRKQGIEAVMSYISAQLEDIDVDYEKLIIAYEPVWAIGTGVTPKMEEIAETHLRIMQIAQKPILYGGSVNANNIIDIIESGPVFGVLVGSASWDIEDFCQIVEKTKGL
jgi:triosephosphate isomerase